MNLVQWSDGRTRLSDLGRVTARFAGKVPSTAGQEPSQNIRHAFQQYAVLRAKTIFAIAFGTQNSQLPRRPLDRDAYLGPGFGKCNLMRRITPGTYRRPGRVVHYGQVGAAPRLLVNPSNQIEPILHP